MGPYMEPHDWTREDIRNLVSGSTIFLRDSLLTEVPIPEWLRAAAASVDDRTPGERLSGVHPDDRGKVMQTWEKLLDQPGQLISCQFRLVSPEGTAMETRRSVNLLGHPDLSGVLFASTFEQLPIDRETPLSDSDERFDTPDWVLVEIDSAGRCLSIEGMALELYGLPAQEIVGRVLTEFLHPETISDVVGMWASLVNDPNGVRTTRLRILRPDGAAVWVETMAINHLTALGEGSVTIIMTDIGARRGQEQELRASRESFRLLAEETPAVVFRADPSGKITFGNARWQMLLTDIGVSDGNDLHVVVHPDDWATLDELLRRAASGADSVTDEMSDRSGQTVLAFTCRPISDSREGQRELIGTISDVTSTAKLRRELHQDPVTGTLNRSGVEQHLRVAISEQPATTLVLFVDLDGFKAVNDTHGHDIGDFVLKQMGQRLASALRPNDAVGRYGGDEFVIVCHDIDGPDAEVLIAARLAAVMKASILWSGGSWVPAASIGSARATPGDDVMMVLRRADHAMFEIKHARRALSGATGRP